VIRLIGCVAFQQRLHVCVCVRACTRVCARAPLPNWHRLARLVAITSHSSDSDGVERERESLRERVCVWERESERERERKRQSLERKRQGARGREKLGDSPVNYLINQGVMATIQGRRFPLLAESFRGTSSITPELVSNQEPPDS
jgi:hypothetical protein